MAKERDYAAEYRRRIARATAKGYSRAQARGHARRRKGELGIETAREAVKRVEPTPKHPTHHVAPAGALGAVIELVRGHPGNNVTLTFRVKLNPDGPIFQELTEHYRVSPQNVTYASARKNKRQVIEDLRGIVRSENPRNELRALVEGYLDWPPGSIERVEEVIVVEERQ